MSMTEVNAEIEALTGVPASLLTGETAEENIALARALIAYKNESSTTNPQEPEAQFAEWFKQEMRNPLQFTAPNIKI